MALNGGYGLNYDMYRGMSPVQVATYNGGKVPEGFDWSRYQSVQDPSSGWGTGSNIQSGIDAANSYASRTGDNSAEWNRSGLFSLGSQPAAAPNQPAPVTPPAGTYTKPAAAPNQPAPAPTPAPPPTPSAPPPFRTNEPTTTMPPDTGGKEPPGPGGIPWGYNESGRIDPATGRFVTRPGWEGGLDVFVNRAPTGTVTYPPIPPTGMPATPAAPAGMMAPRYMTGMAANPPKDGSSPPPGPDFMGAAGQQGAENAAAAGRQARLNNPNFYGVGGSQTVTFGPDGTPIVTQNLSPEQQALYSADIANRTGASRMASGLLGMGGFGGAFDLSGAPAMPGSYESTRNSVIDALMKRANEDFGRREDQTNSDLIARGIRPGTRAYAEEMARLDRAKNDARSQAEITAGDAVDQAMRSDLARRTQGVNEATLSRTLPFSEYQALSREGGFEMPNLPGYAQNNQVAPAPIFGATTAASNYDVDVWNALMQQENSRNTGLLGLGQTALGSLLNPRSGSGLLGRLGGWLFGGGA